MLQNDGLRGRNRDLCLQSLLDGVRGRDRDLCHTSLPIVENLEFEYSFNICHQYDEPFTFYPFDFELTYLCVWICSDQV